MIFTTTTVPEMVYDIQKTARVILSEDTESYSFQLPYSVQHGRVDFKVVSGSDWLSIDSNANITVRSENLYDTGEYNGDIEAVFTPVDGSAPVTEEIRVTLEFTADPSYELSFDSELKIKEAEGSELPNYVVEWDGENVNLTEMKVTKGASWLSVDEGGLVVIDNTKLERDKEYTGEISLTFVTRAGEEISETVDVYYTVQSGYNLGDVNEDGKVDSLDATAILIAYAEELNETGKAVSADKLPAGDVDRDGKVDSLDATVILIEYAKALNEDYTITSL
jgi:acyl carrier protein